MVTKVKKVNANEIDQLLAIAGYICPRNDEELILFEEVHKNYNFKFKNHRIDPKEIISESFDKKGNVKYLLNKEEQADINNIKMAARKGTEGIPDSILEKMQSKHKSGDK